ncbi:uncharacterized protein LOC125673379 [Ostrea edulis]|uniref:uncharacterized protein LOC125673379 n=1 Tax=Ostrea edulis TaxID=37623 RepID=UPI002094B23C|nr:uncharacterized protein LOC125673379 [Ostrea edulis]
MYQSKGTGQHYIECDTCTDYSQFYCNSCHQRMCKEHRDIHLKENENKDEEHVVVLYQDRTKELPEEKCKIHPQKIIDLNCSDCEVVLCSKCFTQKHNGHTVQDLEIVYNEILQKCRKRMIHIRDAIIPQAMGNLQKQKESVDVVKRETAELRLSMKRHADAIKAAVDAIIADNNAQVDEIEKSIVDDMEEEIKETKDYVSRLQELEGNMNVGMALAKPTELMSLHKELTKAKTTPSAETSRTKLPVFMKGKFSRKDLEIQFGELRLENEVTVEKQPIQDCSFTKPTTIPVNLHLASSVTKAEVTAPSILKNVYHLSFSTSGHFLASDNKGNLIEFDREGNQLQKISTSRNTTGYHTGTAEGEWLYTDYNKKALYRVDRDKAITKLIATGDWVPESIYSSHSNGDILVAMNRNKEWKVTRYSKGGEELQDIQFGGRAQALYHSINFITENINGDICASDFITHKVVVVTRSGQYRFFYSGHRSQNEFWPFGICTDVLGNILVCNGRLEDFYNCSSVHLLDQDGQFLSLLLTPKHCPPRPRAICVDDQHNLWIGCQNSSTICVYTYLHNKDR